MEISADIILFIRGEITRRSPVLMGACNSPVVADSVGAAIFSKFRKAPQAMSYVLPLLKEEGFCRVSDRRPFKIYRLPDERAASEESHSRGGSVHRSSGGLARAGDAIAGAKRAADFDGDMTHFLQEYAYQPALTPRLDALGDTEFGPAIINEIVLWKLNRYISLAPDLLRQLEPLRHLKTGQHRQASAVLTGLLGTHGVDLAMASTILRFRNASVFQIIDRHAYRAVYGSGYPRSNSPGEKVSMYFRYLDELIALCSAKALQFETIDRLLYIFDKKFNAKL